MSARTPEAEPLLTPAEVATMFRVDPKTVTRWAKAGKLTSIRTLGGHRRYRETEVRALLAGIPQQRTELQRTAEQGRARPRGIDRCWPNPGGEGERSQGTPSGDFWGLPSVASASYQDEARDYRGRGDRRFPAHDHLDSGRPGPGPSPDAVFPGGARQPSGPPSSVSHRP